MKARRGAHTVYRLAYHYVWVPRYRRKVLTGGVARRLEEMIREICVAWDWEVEALTVKEDHVHLFVSCPPRDAPARVMNVIKSKTARELYAEFSRLRKTHWGGKLWAETFKLYRRFRKKGFHQTMTSTYPKNVKNLEENSEGGRLILLSTHRGKSIDC